ncbi:MAG: helix-turn-helix domain-containing protein [Cyanobacteria bacterium J06648_11]
MSADGYNNGEQACNLGIDRQRVRRWRSRWSECQPRLAEAEAGSVVDKDLAKLMKEILGDAPRPGGPHTFTAEQVAQIIAVACEPPADHGLPVTHWTPRELAAVVIARGIVQTISERQVGRFLARVTSGQTGVGTG